MFPYISGRKANNASRNVSPDPLVYRTLLNKWRIVMYIFQWLPMILVLGILIYFSFFHYYIVSNLRIYFFILCLIHQQLCCLKGGILFCLLVFLSISYILKAVFSLLLSLLLQNTYNQIIIIHILLSHSIV
jgi:hypothetical protein